MDGGRSQTPLKEIRQTNACLFLNKYDTEGYILIPQVFREHFSGIVKILFDPKENLLVLQPSLDEGDYKTSNWRIWCSAFFREYRIASQKAVARWDPKNKYLIAKIRRD